MLDFEGWYDAFLDGGTENFSGMVANGGTAVCPRQPATGHRPLGPCFRIWGRRDSSPAPLLKDIGPVGDSPHQQPDAGLVRPFPERASPSDVAGKPRVDYFVMGANTWKSATSWPLPQTHWTTFYLSRGLAESIIAKDNS